MTPTIDVNLVASAMAGFWAAVQYNDGSERLDSLIVTTAPGTVELRQKNIKMSGADLQASIASFARFSTHGFAHAWVRFQTTPEQRVQTESDALGFVRSVYEAALCVYKGKEMPASILAEIGRVVPALFSCQHGDVSAQLKSLSELMLHAGMSEAFRQTVLHLCQDSKRPQPQNTATAVLACRLCGILSW